jgi:citronellol/citronellal dehydrogenase
MPYKSVFSPGLFDNRLIVVTGGGSGIGRCTAHELSSLGARCLLIGRTRDKLEKTVAEIDDAGGSAELATCDIRDEAAVSETVGDIIARHGQIAGLVNNAGGQFPAPLAKTSGKGFDAVVRNNLTGGFFMAREVYTQSMSAHGGAIVNIVADFWRGMPNMGHTGAARAGMSNLTKTAAIEWSSSGVRVNAVAPGWVASSGLDKYEGPMRETIRELRHQVPLKRLATESEISAAIVFLLSDAAAFVTGVTLAVDGGAPLMTPLWPIPDHDRAKAFDGFHLSSTPVVLSEGGD